MGVAAPTLQHVVNHLPNGVPGLRAAVAVHQQPVVIAMLVANGRNNGGSQSFFLKRTPGRRPPHPATSAHSSVGRDSPCFIRWAAWKQFYDCLCHQRGEFAILLSAAQLGLFAPGSTFGNISMAFFLGSIQRRLFN